MSGINHLLKANRQTWSFERFLAPPVYQQVLTRNCQKKRLSRCLYYLICVEIFSVRARHFLFIPKERVLTAVDFSFREEWSQLICCLLNVASHFRATKHVNLVPTRTSVLPRCCVEAVHDCVQARTRVNPLCWMFCRVQSFFFETFWMRSNWIICSDDNFTRNRLGALIQKKEEMDIY